MSTKTTKFDAADYLDSEEAIAVYLNDALETGSPAEIQLALGTVARAIGVAKLAKSAGVGRESLYKSIRENGKPEFSTVIKIVNAMGLKLQVAA